MKEPEVTISHLHRIEDIIINDIYVTLDCNMVGGLPEWMREYIAKRIEVYTLARIGSNKEEEDEYNKE